MVVKRESERLLKKWPVEVIAGGKVVKGITVRISEKGFFVRAQAVFNVGTPVDIRLFVSDEKACSLKGVVKYSEKSALSVRQNGMGIELTEKNPEYIRMIKLLHEGKV